MSDDSASDDSPDAGRDAGKVVEEPTGDDDDDDGDDDDDDTGSVMAPDSGPRGAVNSGRDSGTSSQPKDAGASPKPSTPDSGSAAPVDSGSGSGTPPPRDSGTGSPGTTDSGSGSGSGTDSGSSSGNAAQCATTPAYPTKDACSQCICAKCSTQVAGCFASGDTTKDQQCAQVQACAEQNHCTSTNCYCGNADLLCLFPAGACIDVIRSVAGSESGLDILSIANDAQHPVGRANQIGLCVNDNCRQECGI